MDLCVCMCVYCVCVCIHVMALTQRDNAAAWHWLGECGYTVSSTASSSFTDCQEVPAFVGVGKALDQCPDHSRDRVQAAPPTIAE